MESKLTVMMDTREKPQAVQTIMKQFEAAGVRVIRTKLWVADYQLLDNPYRVVDRKANLQELVGNVCQQHKRFATELARAQEVGISVVVLVEHGGGIKSLEDVPNWVNPRLKVSPLAVSGERLYKILKAMEYTYKARFEFCDKRQTGKRILQILMEGKDGNTETET